MDLATIAIISAATGTGISAYGSYQQGRYQQQVSEHAAEGAEIQARQAYLDEISNLKPAADRRRAMIGTMASQIAKSGAGFEGAPLYLLEEAHTNLLTEQQRQSQQLLAQQQSLLAQGTLMRAEGSLSRSAGTFGAVGGLLSGAGTMYSMYSQGKTPSNTPSNTPKPKG